mgnify:CR=1 FL=1
MSVVVRPLALSDLADLLAVKGYAVVTASSGEEALAKLDDTGRLLMILEALPPVITAVGGVAKEIMVPVSQAIGEGLGNIDEVRIIDMGQGGQAGDGEGSICIDHP